jgi:Protein of unknown function (DUF3574)
MYRLRHFVFATFLVFGFALNTALARETSDEHTHATASERTLCRLINGDIFMRTELFFGLSRLGAPEISDQEFQNFVDGQVTPRFPDGLTLLTGKGQFRNAAGLIVQEGSKLLILLYPFSKQSSAAVDEIRTEYKNTFQQESVLRVDEPSCVSF